VEFILNAIEEKIVEQGGAGRFATWKIPINMAFTYGSTEYAFDVGEGRVSGFDREHMEKLMAKYAGEIKTRTYENKETGERADNFLLIVGESIIFGEE
jgi:hypothetical protein